MKARVVKRISGSAVVTRADGTVEDYGTVFNSRWGPLRRWWATRRIKRINRKHGF